MGQPTPTDAHVDRVLTNISIAYMQEATNFIASRVFPIVPTARQTDKYFTYDQEDWFRLEAKKRAACTEAAGRGDGGGPVVAPALARAGGGGPA